MRQHPSGLWADAQGGIHRPDGVFVESDFYRMPSHTQTLTLFHEAVERGERTYDVLDWIDFVGALSDRAFFDSCTVIDS